MGVEILKFFLNSPDEFFQLVIKRDAIHQEEIFFS